MYLVRMVGQITMTGIKEALHKRKRPSQPEGREGRHSLLHRTEAEGLEPSHSVES